MRSGPTCRSCTPAESVIKEVGFVDVMLEIVNLFGKAGW
jgi:hypothetical protein